MASPSRGRWPLGFLGMIVLVSAVEFTLSRQTLRFADTASLNWRLAVDDVAREGPDAEVACLGDSLTKVGVVPEVVRSLSGLRAYNFGMARAPAQATFFVFRRLVESGARPKALVVDFKSSIQAGKPRAGLRHFQEVADLRESWEFLRADGNLNLVAPFLIGRIVPSVRYRLEIREAILCALGGTEAPTISTNRLALRNWTINLGNHFNASNAPFSGEIPARVLDGIGVENWRCHRINKEYIDKLFALAEDRRIPVYWIIPPLSPPLQERRERMPVDDQYSDFAREMLAKHPGVTVVDGRHSGYDLSTFSDSTHLNGRGALAFSHDLAEILAHPGGRPRWVDLPQFREWATDVLVEDIEQGRAILAAEAAEKGIARSRSNIRAN